jgi:hypothetical protein
VKEKAESVGLNQAQEACARITHAENAGSGACRGSDEGDYSQDRAAFCERLQEHEQHAESAPE